MADDKLPEIMVEDGEVTEDLTTNYILRKTIMTSAEAISNLTNDCKDMVMNVQVANDMREINRREEESKLSKSRNQFIENEAKKTREKIEIINSRWESIAELKDSVDIHGAYESQKNHYLELIEQKDEVIRELQKELDEADEKYVRDQNLHREDIKILSRRMNEHVDIMRKAYRKHLKLIENTAVEEQKSLLRCRHTEWERENDIFEREKEEDMNELSKLVETYEKETVDTIWEHSENHRSMKRDLETKLQTLQIKVKETKAHFMLEERKLEYNYLVLSKRQEELGPIKAQQRRRINRYHDELTNLENEERELEKTFEVQCAHLESDISKLILDRETLAQKMKRTDEVNENIFYRIWRLNEKRIRKVTDIIVKMDQQISEQVLYLKWSAPILKQKTVSELPSIQLYTERVPNFQNEPDSKGAGETTFMMTVRNYPQLTPDFDLLKFILNNVINCMKFVIRDKIDCLTEDLDEEKKTLVKFDNILKILDIESESELETLKEYFIPYIKCSTCASKNGMTFPSIKRSKTDQNSSNVFRTGSGNLQRRGSTTIVKRPSSTPSTFDRSEKSVHPPSTFCCNSEHRWAIDQCIIVKILASFLQDRKQRRKKSSRFTKIPLARVLAPSDIELYWKSFEPSYFDELRKLWDILCGPLNDYLQLLKDGNAIENEIKLLEKQNMDLRLALNPFLKKSCKLEDGSKTEVGTAHCDRK